MPRIPPENVRPTGSVVPPENVQPIVEAPLTDEVGALPAGMEVLDEGGAIDPAVGITEIDSEVEGNDTYTMEDGEEDGQHKLIFLRQDEFIDNTRTVRCNLYRSNDSNYAAINSGVRLCGAGAWVLLRWTEDVPTSSGDRDLWVIVGGSQILPQTPAKPSTVLIGHGRGVEADDDVTVQLFPIIPEGGSGLSGVRMPFTGSLKNFFLRYAGTENISGQLTLRVFVNDDDTDYVVAGNYNSPAEQSFSEEQSLLVEQGDLVLVQLLGVGIGTGGVLTASLSMLLEETAVPQPPHLLIQQGTVPS